jgi:sterol desaturase/sphingolipid hydroxylase (fatty acid hydroxylase superfamily)
MQTAYREPKTRGLSAQMLYYGLQPLILVSALSYWSLAPSSELTYVLIVLAVQLVLGTLEHWQPARPTWVIQAKQKCLNILLVVFLVNLSFLFSLYYESILLPPLDFIRARLGIDFWPHQWPLVLQVFLAFLCSEFIWYWLHRAEHRWQIFWRASGHGAHHAFKKLNALNFGLNHPLESLVLLLPPLIVEVVFGVGIASAGATILVVTQASIAHTNLSFNSKLIGLVLTTNTYHIRHHSALIEESNTNYGCAAIIWDRIFGTFADSSVLEVGIGPTEPTLWEKLLMPIKEPKDSAVAPK